MRIIILMLALISFIEAQDLSFLIGMRSSKYGSIGVEYKDIGFIIENSIFIDDVNNQYIRTKAYHNFLITNWIHLTYTLFYGSRYNHDYFDYGGILETHIKSTGKTIQAKGTFLPFYDSNLGHKYSYSASLIFLPFSEVGIIGGIRNIPEYRIPEKRVFSGLVFDLPHLWLQPEISTPLRRNAKSVTRLTFNFIYKSTP